MHLNQAYNNYEYQSWCYQIDNQKYKHSNHSTSNCRYSKYTTYNIRRSQTQTHTHSRDKRMDIRYLKRDLISWQRRSDWLLSPSQQNSNLTLKRGNVTEEYLLTIREVLRQSNCAVQKLQITRVNFTDLKARILAKAISENDSLNELKFKHCKMRVTSLDLLMDAVGSNEAITSIDFRDMKLVMANLKSISVALCQNMSIKRLVLQETGIGDNSMVALSNGISEALNLEVIDLEYNKFEDVGFKALMKAMRKTMACKILLLQGVHINVEMAQELGFFLEDPNCKIEEIHLAEAEFSTQVFIKICSHLMKCHHLKSLSFSRNILGNEETHRLDIEKALGENLKATDGRQVASISEDDSQIVKTKIQSLLSVMTLLNDHLLRLSISHSQMGDTLFGRFADGVFATKLKYLNLSWNGLTRASVPQLCLLLSKCQLIEKLLIQHNQIGQEDSIRKIMRVLKNKQLKYLDISATELSSQSFRHIFELMKSKDVKLSTLQCRKNRIEGCQIKGIFLKLHNNTFLNVLDLSENSIKDENASEILDFVKHNIYLEEVILSGNKDVHANIQDTIDDECQMNCLIKHHILPKLKMASSTGFKSAMQKKNCCADFDVSGLLFESCHFFSSDFIFKFIQINHLDVSTLQFRHTHLQNSLFFPNNLHQQFHNMYLREVTIEACPIDKACWGSLIGSIKFLDHIIELNVVNMQHLESNLGHLCRVLKHHPTIEILNLSNNQIQVYEPIVEMIIDNEKIKSLDLRGNYLNEEILEQIWVGMHHNMSLTQILFDTKDVFVEPEALESIMLETEINRHIIDYILPKIAKKQTVNRVTHARESHIDFTGIKCQNPAAFLKFLKLSKGVKSVNLTRTDLSVRLVQQLVQSVIDRSLTLESIDFSENMGITDQEWAESLSKMFWQSHSIKTLKLNKTCVGLMGLITILKSIENNTTVQGLYFNDCGLEISVEETFRWSAILECTKHSCSLMNLELSGNKIPQILTDSIDKELEMNRLIVKHIFPIVQEQEKNYLKRKANYQLNHRVKRSKTDDRLRKKGLGDRKEQNKLQKTSYDGKTKLLQSENSVEEEPANKSLLIGQKSEGEKKIGKSTFYPSNLKTKTDFRATSQTIMQRNAPTKKKRILFNLDGVQKQQQKTKEKSEQPLKDDQNMQGGGSLKMNKIPANNSEIQSDRQSENESKTVFSSNDSMSISQNESQFSINTLSDPKRSKKHLHMHMSKQHHVNLVLKDMKLNRLDFLSKFIREFPHIQHIDLSENQLSNKEMEKFVVTLKDNKHIQKVQTAGTRMSYKTKEIMKKELEKNKLINGVLGTMATSKRGEIDSASAYKTLNLRKQGVNDLTFLNKMLTDFALLEDLNLAENQLGDAGAKQVEQILKENFTIKRVNLSKNMIGPDGLQTICSALCDPDCEVQEIDISENPIPDKSLKMLMAMLYQNKSITKMKYTLTEKENQKRYERFQQIQNLDGSLKIDKQDGHHALTLPLWQKIVFPIWIWKTFIHAKHEAFRFKYDSKLLLEVEENDMKHIGQVLYWSTLVYYLIIFAGPLLFIEEQCLAGFDMWIFYVYAAYALLTAIWEVAVVLLIQRRIRSKEVLSFNRWHVVELFMGQIARFDTFLDACFFVLLIQCNIEYLAIPVGIFIFLQLAYPLYQIFALIKVNKSLQHTQPYMERNCFLSFIRENMLLGTVLDSFCIDNSVVILQKPIAFGKFMGAYTFFCQDLPQLLIHLYFLVFVHGKYEDKLHKHPVVLIALVVGFFAISISTFNFAMFKQNDFDPIVIERELFKRNRAKRASKEQTHKEHHERKVENQKKHFKKRMSLKPSTPFITQNLPQFREYDKDVSSMNRQGSSKRQVFLPQNIQKLQSDNLLNQNNLPSSKSLVAHLDNIQEIEINSLKSSVASDQQHQSPQKVNHRSQNDNLLRQRSFISRPLQNNDMSRSPLKIDLKNLSPSNKLPIIDPHQSDPEILSPENVQIEAEFTSTEKNKILQNHQSQTIK